jgi:hypothetical protein
MMMGRRIGMIVLAAMAAGACGDSGGELREVTQRRRAELDTTGDAAGTGAAPDTSSRLPAIARDTPPPGRADSARGDTAKPAANAGGGWGTAARQTDRSDVRATLRGLRAASNTGFDRLVLDFGDGALPGWRAEYVTAAYQCGSGDKVDVGTDAILMLRLRQTQAHDDAGRPTLHQRDLTLSMPVMHRMVVVCDFEGVVEIAIGAVARQPYRVTELQNPSRIAIDLQQPAGSPAQ